MIGMKPVHASLKQWMQTNKNFQHHLVKIKHEVLTDSAIQDFLMNNPQLTQQVIEKNLVTLYEYKTQSKQCSHCTSLGSCQNILKGYTPLLQAEGETTHLSYVKCHHLQTEEKQQEQHELFQSRSEERGAREDEKNYY